MYFNAIQIEGRFQNMKILDIVKNTEGNFKLLVSDQGRDFIFDIDTEPNISKELNDTGSGWVVVFPRGKHFINKYKMTLNCDDKFFGSIKEWWDKSTFKKPFLDKGHEFNEKFGEFSQMKISDKGLEMFLTLNEDGKELVKSGKYEYLSPTFDDASDSNGVEFKNVIFTVSLVNYPALLVLDKITSQIALSFDGEKGKIDNNKKGGSGMELREIVASKLKLSLMADDASILAKIEELINSGITIEDLQTKIEEMKSALAQAQTEAQVNADKATKAESALSVIQGKMIEDEASTIINKAIECGQYHPALKEMKVSQYVKDKDSVVKELAVLPKVKTGKQESKTSIDDMEFSAENKAILLSVGYDLNDPKDLELARIFLASQKGGN